jgi:hypothetical protein
MAAVPLSRDPRTRAQVVTSGAWRHMPAPTDVPDWLSEARRTFKGLIAFAPPDAADDMHLVVRAAVQTPDGKIARHRGSARGYRRHHAARRAHGDPPGRHLGAEGLRRT